MIGVVASRADIDVVEEFFELFKTPWEWAVVGRNYRVILGSSSLGDYTADVVLSYGSAVQTGVREASITTEFENGPVDIRWGQWTFPVYKGVRLFGAGGQEEVLKVGVKSADYLHRTEECTFRRIGYNLFDEVRYLLTEGQPVTKALSVTLELHIELIRYLLTNSNIAFAEIPPRPTGYDFMCCLTHDVDFWGIRRHMFDRTMAGFLYRSSMGSLIDLIRGRRTLSEAVQNWVAFCFLPFVLVGALPDFWRPFEDYAKVEDRRRSTFFLVPFKGKPGVSPDSAVNSWRATAYGINDVHEELMAAAASGSELAVHGIDAWCDAAAGREEMRQLTSVTGQKATGIRMHWLYYDTGAPKRLEAAGFDYDSTWGYNEAVGYRAGTSQAFCPLGNHTLMELPMSLMDSALLSAGRMALAPEAASKLCQRIVANARRFGGTLVINWHDRSLAPERLWGRIYQELLTEVSRGERAWFATAGEAVQWFRWRRSIRFDKKNLSDGSCLQVSASRSAHPGAIIRVYRTGSSGIKVEDIPLDGVTPVEIVV